MPKFLGTINRNWFDTTEALLVVSSIGGSVAAIVFQQVTFAAITSIPLSLVVSLNSYNRRRLDEVTQQHQVSVVQLEQKFSNNQDFFDKVLSSLPTHSELVDIESRFSARTTTFTEQLDTLNKQQNNTYLELQQINTCHHKLADIQQRVCVLESLLQPYNPTHLRIELQETQVSVEEKIKKLEQQFNNLPLFDLQQQLLQIQHLVEKLQVSSTESTQLNKYLLGEIQSISQQIQTLTGKTEELSLAHTQMRIQLNLLESLDIEKLCDEIKFISFNDLKTSFKTSTELNQQLAEEIQSLHEQMQAVSSSVSERITALRVELQSHQISVEKSETKIHADLYELADWYKQLETQLQKRYKKSNVDTSIKIEKQEITKTIQYMCEHCHRNYQKQPIKGGHFLNYNFCSHGCKFEYENRNC
jgi:ribosomal protein S10